MKQLAARLAQTGARFPRARGFETQALTRRKLVVLCLSVFFAAVGVRLLQWQNNWFTIDRTMAKLTERYKGEAQFLLDGDLTSFVRGNTPEPDPGILMHPPGYPVLMAAVYKLTGHSDASLRLFQILADAAAAVLVFLIAAELLPAAIALISGLVVAFSPQFAYSSLLLLPDSVSALPILLAIYLVVWTRNRPRLWTFIAAGACLGVSCWLRANALLLAPFLSLLILVLFERGRRWRYAAALVGVAFLVILPITIRNAVVFKSFIPVSLSAGQNLVAGIADYDPEKKFGFEAYDDAAQRQEAQMYNRPDYAFDLYRPDGVLRERLRTARALSVIRSNKLWFLGTMLCRAAVMLENEKVPIVSVEPTITNQPEVTDGTELAWANSPTELAANNTAPAAQLSLTENNQALRITGQFTSASISVQRKSDYLLRLPVAPEQGRMSVRVLSADGRTTLASASIPDSLEPGAQTVDDMTVLQLPFVNSGADEVRVVLADAELNQPHATARVGRMELFRLGPAAHLWTRYPRALVKMVQKFFKTAWLLTLALAGLVLLALARKGRALAVALVVPAYYMSVHSPLHVEPRYVLAMHYFFSILIASALFWFGARFWDAAKMVYSKVRPS